MERKVIRTSVLLILFLASITYLIIKQMILYQGAIPLYKLRLIYQPLHSIVSYRQIIVNSSATSPSLPRIYFPGDPLPEKLLYSIRQLSHPILKRRLTKEEYNEYLDVLHFVVRIFTTNNIRYSLMSICKVLQQYIIHKYYF